MDHFGPRLGRTRRSPAGAVILGAAATLILMLVWTAGAGRSAARADGLAVSPPPVMEVHTISDQAGVSGVSIVNPTTGVKSFYPVSPSPGQWLQVVVLDRSTLRLVSNTTLDCRQACAAELKSQLSSLDGTKLVIVSDQLWSKEHTTDGPANLADALGNLGVGQPPPWLAHGQLPAAVFSAIGVPKSGKTLGFSTYRYSPGPASRGDINGYLIRNAEGHYTFQSWEHISFNTSASHDFHHNFVQVGEKHLSAANGGFQVVIVDRYSGKATSTSFVTSDPNTAGERLDRMAALLEAADAPGANDLVIVTSVGYPRRRASCINCGAQEEVLDKPVTRVAFDIAKLGGTVGPIFTAMDPRAQFLSYTLVGQSRAGYGRGLESSKSGTAISEGNLAPITGTLTRSSTDFGLSVENEEVVRSVPVVDVVNHRPGPWPRQNNAADNAALAWIAEEQFQGADPRTQYYSSRSIDWSAKKIGIESLRMPERHPGFEQENFTWAKGELIHEIGWLLIDRHYFEQLAKPYADSAFSSWAKLTHAAAKVNEQVRTPAQDKVGASMRAVVLGLADIGKVIPGAGHAIEVARVIYTVALELGEINREESEPESFHVKVGELGEEVAKLLDGAQQTITNTMFNETVADYHKLKTVAECVQAEKTCKMDPGAWQITPDDYRQAAKGFQLSLEQMFYGALLSAKYTAWATPSFHTHDPRRLIGKGLSSSTRQPFTDVAPGAYMVRVNRYNVYEQWVLANFDGDTLYPSFELPREDVVKRLWRPIDQADPTATHGGLGLNREEFFAQWFEPPRQLCGFSLRSTPLTNCKMLAG
jgi:hypothetical protein